MSFEITAKAGGSAWFCVGLCLATQRHKNETQEEHNCDTSDKFNKLI
jgi:hypothetical protein